MNSENKITTEKNILVVLTDDTSKLSTDANYLINNFCGTVVYDFSTISNFSSNTKIYVCGNIDNSSNNDNILYVIKEISYNYQEHTNKNIRFVELGKVPININKVGVYYRHFFDGDDYFDKIVSEHVFQELTESNKESKALRKGIYLTEVEKEIKDTKEILNFHLLRCSSNLTGATENFRSTDSEIINSLNDSIQYVFDKEVKLNHVLAQIYENKKGEGNKEVKAKIKAHSDKTKDMPTTGLIAFCTFYDTSTFNHLEPSKEDKYDWCYKKTSGLTKLHFKLKNEIDNEELEKEFSVTLYPNSVFLIPLSTNRLYTHEIRPSMLNIDRIPVRMGYVVRCSNLEASYIDNQTYIKEDEKLVKLEPMTEETIENLRTSYYKENKTREIIKYGKVHFSMNSGDYKKPIY